MLFYQMFHSNNAIILYFRSNKKYFEVYGITTSCQEYLRTFGNESAFLTLNLKSILFNLNITKTKE